MSEKKKEILELIQSAYSLEVEFGVSVFTESQRQLIEPTVRALYPSDKSDSEIEDLLDEDAKQFLIERVTELAEKHLAV